MKIINRTITLDRPSANLEHLAERYAEIALSVRRSMMLLITFTLFCIAVLFVSDEYFIPELGKTIKTSLFGLPLNAKNFIFIGPIILIVITVYFNIFLNKLYSDAFKKMPTYRKHAHLLTFNTRTSKWITIYLSTFNIPIIMIAYSVKISPHPHAIYFYLFTVITVITAVSMSSNIKQCYKHIFLILSVPLIVLSLLNADFLNQFKRGYYLVIDKKFNMSGRDFSKASLNYSNFEGVPLYGANFTSAIMYGANLSKAKLRYANLSKAKLLETNLSGADLSQADLSGAFLLDTNLSEADLTYSNLTNTKWYKSNLTRADLSNADLTGADLSGAFMYGADMTVADLTDVDLTGANLKGVLGITCKQMRSVKEWGDNFDGIKCDTKNEVRSNP